MLRHTPSVFLAQCRTGMLHAVCHYLSVYLFSEDWSDLSGGPGTAKGEH